LTPEELAYSINGPGERNDRSRGLKTSAGYVLVITVKSSSEDKNLLVRTIISSDEKRCGLGKVDRNSFRKKCPLFSE
jgi:hypothetical protein